MRIVTQLRLAAVVALAVTVGATLAVGRVLERAALVTQQLDDTQRVARSVASLIALTQEYTAFGLSQSAQQWEAHYRVLVATLAAARTRAGAPPELGDLSGLAADLHEMFTGLSAVPVLAVRTPAAAALEARRRELLIERLVAASQEMVQLRWRWAQDVSEQQQAVQRELAAIIGAAAVLYGLIIGGLVWLVFRRVMAPLQQLRRGAEAIRGGDLSARCRVEADDELGEVAQAVDVMAQTLQREGQTLVALNRDLGHEAQRRTRSEQQMQLITDQMPLQIQYIDLERRYRFVNAACLAEFGLPLEQVLGRRHEEVTGRPESPEVQARLQAALAGMPQHFVTAGGGQPGHMLELHLMPDRGEDGRVRGVITTVADITERLAQERTLRDALAERETLLREVYHRVKNNLQVVQSLLNLQRRSLPPGAARTALDDSIQRVRAMALVHEKLYIGANLERVPLPEYLRDLLRQLGEAASGSARDIALVADIQEGAGGELQLDAAVPFGLLVAELVGNSLKHGFPNGGPGQVRVRLWREHGRTRLRVEDNGQGLPSGFGLVRRDTMGLQLAQSLATQLGGTLEVAASTAGAAFEASLPRLDPAVAGPALMPATDTGAGTAAVPGTRASDATITEPGRAVPFAP